VARARKRRPILRGNPVLGVPVGPSSEWNTRQVLALLVVVVVLAAFSFVLFPGSSDLRWTVLALVLVIIGAAVFLSLYRSGARMPRLQPLPESEQPILGRLSRLSDVLDRADRGMRFSQVSIAWRVRKAFLMRLQSERNLREEELATILSSPADLERVVGDPVIEAFLEDTAPAEEGHPELRTQDPAAFRFPRRGGYTRGLARVLAAMEAWQ
jgi:hypothetical protein